MSEAHQPYIQYTEMQMCTWSMCRNTDTHITHLQNSGREMSSVTRIICASPNCNNYSFCSFFQLKGKLLSLSFMHEMRADLWRVGGCTEAGYLCQWMLLCLHCVCFGKIMLQINTCSSGLNLCSCMVCWKADSGVCTNPNQCSCTSADTHIVSTQNTRKQMSKYVQINTT